jgi:hypothetical protein
LKIIEGFNPFITGTGEGMHIKLHLHRHTWPRQQHWILSVFSLCLQTSYTKFGAPSLITGTKIISVQFILFGLTSQMLMVLYVMTNCVIYWGILF